MRDAFRTAVVAIYWIALPFALLVCAGWLFSALASPSSMRLWMMTAGAAAFSGLIGWRLWLNNRALGRGGPMPPARRLLLVFLPLGMLALVGFAVAALGLAWLVAGIWILFAPEAATSGFRDLVSGPALPIGGGAVLILIGGALIAPMAFRLRARPTAADR
jgi:hypothetical protein